MESSIWQDEINLHRKAVRRSTISSTKSMTSSPAARHTIDTGAPKNCRRGAAYSTFDRIPFHRISLPRSRS